ncbi:hypothetical protein BGW38_010712 [Lunasporangiospora selenospora]|uniref:Uncharacterized protein n=1 Tax=Lunasporangiospora selenospora TaxID=979761 RepID=A0A9P6FXD5_9FUNG|nr:hypothetical protein BGW38_010712 [Lunasporangiospora selenospora]
MFQAYSKNDILVSLELTDKQLTVLAIVSNNDYSRKIVRELDGTKDVGLMVKEYLLHDRVRSRNTGNQDFANATRVFATLTQTPASAIYQAKTENKETFGVLCKRLSDILGATEEGEEGRL